MASQRKPKFNLAHQLQAIHVTVNTVSKENTVPSKNGDFTGDKLKNMDLIHSKLQEKVGMMFKEKLKNRRKSITIASVTK